MTTQRWVAAPSRYRWPAPITNWGEVTPVGSKQRYYRLAANPIAKGERGKLTSATLVRSEGASTIRSHFASEGFPSAAVPKYGVRIYKMVYESIDAFGLPIPASGALLLPDEPTNAVPLLSYQHATTFSRVDVPSRGLNIEGEFFASDGYAVLMPDYIGMGDSPGFQVPVHSRTEAAAVIDLLRAARIFFSTNGPSLNGHLFLLGYSQGGHASLAVQREIETFHTNEFAVSAAACLAGVYDVSATYNALLNSTNSPYPGLFANLLPGYLPVYQFADTIEELLAPAYNKSLPPLLDGLDNYNDFNFLPAAPANILKPEVRSDFRQNSNSAWQRALADNNVLDWVPKVPVLLLHGSGDTAVPLFVAKTTLQTFQKNGACCVTLVVDPGGTTRLDHNTIFTPGLAAAKAWIDGQVR